MQEKIGWVRTAATVIPDAAAVAAVAVATSIARHIMASHIGWPQAVVAIYLIAITGLVVLAAMRALPWQEPRVIMHHHRHCHEPGDGEDLDELEARSEASLPSVPRAH